ncbi:alpha/beta hydrolase family protein [Planctomycetota bacterium]
MCRSPRPWPVFIVPMFCLPPLAATGGPPPTAPHTVKALSSDFDPRGEPLDAQVVREWEKDGDVFRYVTYHVGTFKGVKARMAAFYGLPKGDKKTPGLLHLHGGGQRAFLHEVEFYAQKGYACLSINWGGREMEESTPGDPNTDWGAVDPTQRNVPGYFNLQPGEKYLDPFESPRNNNWYLLTLGARRGLTFLEQQPQVDPERLGVYGHSMGGNLTVYVAGADRRVKVAAPSVGGSGFRTYPWPLLPEQRKHSPNGDVKLFRATLGFQSYAPHVTAPLLWLGATNDFHGIMDDTYRTGALIPHQQVRYAFTPHMNHRFTPEFAVARPLWIDQHLKGTFHFPATPDSRLALSTGDGVPRFHATPDDSMPVVQVNVYYSVDPDPQARFWRSAEAVRKENTWSARLPIMSSSQPLFAFANVHYGLAKPQPVPFAPPTETFAISSWMHTALPKDLRREGVKATDTPALVIDDCARGFQDWYTLSPDNPHHWQFWTRKITDPKWQGRPGYRLTFDVKAETPNELVVVLTENFFRSYRGKKQDFAAVVKLAGGDRWRTVSLSLDDFKALSGENAPSSWANVDLLGLRAYYEEDGRLLGSKTWAGSQPTLRNLRWTANRGMP